jgi:hypothetical protein
MIKVLVGVFPPSKTPAMTIRVNAIHMTPIRLINIAWRVFSSSYSNTGGASQRVIVFMPNNLDLFLVRSVYASFANRSVAS